MRFLPVGHGVLLGVLLGSVALLITVGASLPQLAHPSAWPAEQSFTVAGNPLLPVTRDGYTTATAVRQITPPPATSAPLPAEPAPSVQPAHRPAVRRTATPSPTPTPTATPSPTVTPSPSPSPKLLHRLVTSLPLPL